MLTVVLCSVLATSSVWIIITSIAMSNLSDKYKVVLEKRVGDEVTFQTCTGKYKSGVLAADWVKGDKYVIVEGIKEHYVPYVIRADKVKL